MRRVQMRRVRRVLEEGEKGEEKGEKAEKRRMGLPRVKGRRSRARKITI